ncbi:MAG: U32 family peptidase [Bacilli bacterium]|nr:U32 family peptidase [Bacilli bacterium]
MNEIELLSPVGDFECLKAAVQNGANAVYLGASSFSARANAKNFNLDELKNAIEYATLRNVKIHLALNTLIKNDEWDEAIQLAVKAYEYGVSAIIVQDIGLAQALIKAFPDLPIHASTQMTIHNLEGAKFAKEMGFARVVLSRELCVDEIRFIHSNCDIELEAFIHGALCICYSGQCLMSSAINARSR